MKKLYSKPEIMFEDFTLTENIAAGCEEKISTHTKGRCHYESTGGIRAFTESISGCDFKPDDGMWNGFCYHNPTEDANLFNS